VQTLLDVVAAQPEAQLDAPRDPRVGMAGESYGGTIQLVAAALDDRIDAIMPALAWHDLPSAVTRNGAFKSSWMTLLAGAGLGYGLADGYNASQGPQAGSIDPRLLTLTAAGLATGRLGASDVAWLAARGPAHLLDRVKAPALLLQSTADTLFPLDHAVRLHERLRAAGTPSKLVWYCGGGHGACPTSPGPAGVVDAVQLAWLDRWLRDGAPVEEDFEWVADDGVWRSAPAFPPPADGLVAGTGRGALTLVAGAVGSAGLPFGAGVPPTITMPEPDPAAVRVRLAPVAEAADVAGAPRLQLTYRGLALPASTFAFAQLVDERAGRVVGFQTVPVPLVLDGRMRTVEATLGHVALRLGPESRLRVELATASPLHAPQRSTGRVEILDARAALAYAR
jgi:ABC-2 type transport system ATP-binding protein